jgi:hypothetical protein
MVTIVRNTEAATTKTEAAITKMDVAMDKDQTVLLRIMKAVTLATATHPG